MLSSPSGGSQFGRHYFTPKSGSLDESTEQLYQELFPIDEDLNSLAYRFCTMTTYYTFKEKYQRPFFDSYLIFLRDYLAYAYGTLQSNLFPIKNRPIYQEAFICFLETMKEMKAEIGPQGQDELKCSEDLLVSLRENREEVEELWPSKKARLR
jgi:hypothetical protein